MPAQVITPEQLADFREAAHHLEDVLAFHYPNPATTLLHPMDMLNQWDLPTLENISNLIVDSLPVAAFL